MIQQDSNALECKMRRNQQPVPLEVGKMCHRGMECSCVQTLHPGDLHNIPADKDNMNSAFQAPKKWNTSLAKPGRMFLTNEYNQVGIR